LVDNSLRSLRFTEVGVDDQRFCASSFNRLGDFWEKS
jgi:hypothetical protein